ncbi:hypothetical protein HJC23_001034 [Cyclotella cryptica]|uniref:Uncharacterized protein n=1 Tax=Cyclotella cryptica TaxID=29204 RepID=A0ABD3P1T6_9STRA|eukprot:CCRYP_018017-RA/>CCRYP_018017-RA protein AED:0.05 eAED:-0.00 QI:0/-1/0/1/-1/1/1/0/337
MEVNQEQKPVILHQYPGMDIPTEIEVSFDSSASTAITTISFDDTQERLKELYESTHIETAEQKLERALVPKLASRAYHLPGNDFAQDWKQYVLNNHPVLGVCFHHRLHPLKTGQRLIMLVGSFAFGIAITNAIYFWFLRTGRDSSEEVFALSFSVESDKGTPTQKISFSYGLVALLTVGSGSHALFDRFVWSLSACKMCRPGGRFESRTRCHPNFGKYIVILIVVLVVCGASMVVVIRALTDKGESDIDIFHYNSKYSNVEAQDFRFLIGYLVEFAVSLFVMNPLIEFTLFCGILGCCSLPVVGGRSREVALERKAEKEQQKKQIKANVKDIMNCPV